MRTTKQLSIFLENRPGLLAHATNILGENKVSITAMSIHDMVDLAVVRMICDNPTKATLLLEHEEFYVIELDVIVMEIPNSPGTIAAIARKLALADINIDYAYYTANQIQSQGVFVIRTKEIDRAKEALHGMFED